MNNMIDEKQLSKLRYFLECYFNISCDYSELDSIINECRESENEEYIRELKEEVRLILLANDMEFIVNFIKKYGMRTMTDDKSRWLINQIMDKI